MSDQNLPRRSFLRSLVTLPMLGGGVSLIGAPTAVAEPVTPELIGAYHRWLELERYLLGEEMPRVAFPARSPLDLTGGSDSEVKAARRAEERLAKLEADFIAEHCHFRARARLGGKSLQSSVDQYYLTRDMAIVSPPASTRAALVLSAVGCDWRG